MNYPELKKVLDELSEWFEDKYKKDISNGKPNRNGNIFPTSKPGQTLHDSVKCSVETTQSGYRVNFKAEDYWIFVESGRKAGKGVPPNILESWVIDRNIQFGGYNTKQMTYLINRSIKQHGIKAKPFFQDSYDDVEDEWYQKIIDALKIDLTNMMSDEITLKLNKITLKI